VHRRRLYLSFFVFALFIASGSYIAGQRAAPEGAPPKPTNLQGSQAAPEPVKIAEGTYAIFKEYGGIGPVDAEIYNFHEDWSISRTVDGNYQVEGTRSFESPKDFPREVNFLLRMSPHLQLIEAQEDTWLVWISHSAPLTCVFLPKQLQCSMAGKDPRKNPDLSLSMDKPYAFSWPLSAFSLAALTGQCDRFSGRSMDVQFVDVEQPSNDLPLMPITTNGTLRFIGPDKVMVAGRSWDADKFELRAFMSPLPRKSVLWISKGGLLLVLEAEREFGPKGRLELTRFEEEAPSSLFP
jgi:hypothetical protein